MKKNMKSAAKILLLAALTFFSASRAFSFTENSIQQVTLESGLKIYVLEDPASAPVRLELDVGAGYSAQTAKTAGFFELYARLAGGEINSDSVKIIKTVAPADTEKAVASLASILSPISLTDKELRASLNSYRKELGELASSPAGFINTAIDSRVFPAAPWKSQTGFNPDKIFSASVEECRSILQDISRAFYTSRNAVLYASGNVTKEEIVSYAKKYFYPYSQSIFPDADSTLISSASSPDVEKSKKQRKFVLVNEELSSDITQLVIQYGNFSTDKADFLSTIFENDASTLKSRLMEQKNLAIRHPQYIHASSAQKRGVSRLIFQSILEKSTVSPAAQAEKFLEVLSSPDSIRLEEAAFARMQIAQSFSRLSSSSESLMELLSFWNSISPSLSPLSELFARNSAFEKVDVQELAKDFSGQEPVVFVLVNENVYKKYQKQFEYYGYSLITKKNGPWHKLPQYARFLKNQKEEKKSNILPPAERFISENKKQFTSFTLANGIPVTVKKMPESETAACTLIIQGGDLLFAKESPGLASVLADAIAANTRKELYAMQMSGAFSGFWEVKSNTTAEYSAVTVSSSQKESLAAIDALSRAVIFSEITPVTADSVIYALRRNWRIQTGSPEFQLYCEAVRQVYKGDDYTRLFADTKEKPDSALEFSKIAAAYPLFLDSSRYSFVISGGSLDCEKLQAALNATFGTLQSVKATENIQTKVSQKSLPKRQKKLTLRHQFFTDISADKAGPRPAVLVPTTDFSDPILYVLNAPDLSSTDSALFNSLLYELAARIQQKVPSEQIVKAFPPTGDFPFARIEITKIKHLNSAAASFKEAVHELKEELGSLINQGQSEAKSDDFLPQFSDARETRDSLLQKMENCWLMKELSESGTSDGTNELVYKGLLQSGRGDFYLDCYKAVDQARAEDYFLLASVYLDDEAALTVYSADSKK